MTVAALRLAPFLAIVVAAVIGESAPARAAAGPPFIVASEARLPGAGHAFSDLAVDAAGNAYVAGTLGSSNLPGIDAAAVPNAGVGRRFVARFGPFARTPDFVALVGAPTGPWQTQSGGWADGEESSGLVVDATGNAYVVAHDVSTNFPNIGTQLVRTIGPLYLFKVSSAGAVTRHSAALDPALRRVAAIARDSTGALYLTGSATDGLVTTPGAPFATASVAPGCIAPYVLKLDASAQTVAYATYLGHSGTHGQVCGGRVFTLIQPYFIHPTGFAITVDATGAAYVAGQAEPGFAATPGAVDSGTKVPGLYPYDNRVPAPASHAFVAKINPAGTGIVFNARIGGSLRDRATSLRVDAAGAIVVAGKTSSADFPTSGAALPVGGISGTACALNTPELGFVAGLAADGSRLLFSHVLPMEGGQLDDCGGRTRSFAPALVTADAAGNILVAGLTDPRRRRVRATLGAIVPDPVGAESQSGDQMLHVLSPEGQRLLYASVLPRFNVRGLAVDRWQNVLIVGDSWLQRLAGGSMPVEVQANPFPACASGPVTLTAAVPGANDSGSVDFTVDGAGAGSAPVAGAIAIRSVTLPVGVRRIKATYRGAGPFDGRSSIVLEVPVNQAGACQ